MKWKLALLKSLVAAVKAPLPEAPAPGDSEVKA